MQTGERQPVQLVYAPASQSARRTPLALALALGASLGCAAGVALSFSGFGFFRAWLFFSLALPIALCFMTSSRHLLVASLPALAMMATCLAVAKVRDPRVSFSPPSEVAELLTLFAFGSVAIALVIGGVFGESHRVRQARARASRTNGNQSAANPS